MATDGNYVVPTAVAMKSLIDAERGSNADLYFVIFVDKTTSQKAGVWSSFHSALLTQMGTANPKHVKVCFVDVANIEDRLLEKAAEKYGNRLIALRLVFPKIWKNQELPEFDDYDWLNDIKEFLWLDSDVLVMKPLEPLLDEVGYEAEEGIRQPVISANLDFIYSQNDIPRRYHNYQVWSHSGFFAKESVGAEYRGSAHVSGGVVFWRLDDMPEAGMLEGTISLGRLRRQQQGQGFDPSVLAYCYLATKQSTEESVFNTLLRGTQDKVYFFSTLYNCRPGYVPVAQDFLHNFPNLPAAQSSAELSYIQNSLPQPAKQQILQETFATLQQIAREKVAIWHWDYSASDTSKKETPLLGHVGRPELKPWCVANPEIGSPEALWREEYEAVKQMFEEDADVAQLFTTWEAQNFRG